MKHPEWSKNATLYEVNIRQYTPEGTFKAFESHLPRLKEMGVDILWLMPVHPIGEKNRKGSLGSYYSVKDYYGVNPEFGTLDDLKNLVQEIHELGMYVIIDWVANHSAWDNQLVYDHPEWYTKNHEGNFQPTPWYDWEDIIDFDYEQPGLRRWMIDALKYWVRETDIDGYRCDVAGFVPTDFWEGVRHELEEIKPIFMLAEWESRDLHQQAFDATYAWSLFDRMKDVATGGKGIGRLTGYIAHDVKTFPGDGYRMIFTDNHDKNSWDGNQFHFFGEATEMCIVFSVIVKGIPLVYSGQEAGLERSLAFFEKDEIEWKEHPFYSLFQKLFEIKHQNKALWNGAVGGNMIRILNDKPEQILSFFREKEGNKVIAVFNWSNQPLTVTLDSKYHAGIYQKALAHEQVELKGQDEIALNAWGYLVLLRK